MQKIIYRLLKNKKYFTLKAEGFSMLPLLRQGDILFIRKIKFQLIKINDLIMAKNRKQFFTHRVIFKTQDLATFPPPRGSPFGHPRGVLVAYLITKGDNNLQADRKITPKQILGKVYQIKRNGRIINLENFYLLQSTLYFQEIVKINEIFKKEKIDFVFLKGLPVHLFYERKHPSRIYADCDILIDKADFEKVEKIFVRNGFKKVDASYSSLHKLLKDKPTEISFFKKIHDFPILFDIHFEPVFLMNQLGKLDALYPEKFMRQLTSDFLQAKRTIKVQGEQFFILNSFNLILYLSLHLFHHNYRGIFRLHFLDQVIRFRARELDLYKLISDINKYQVQNFVYPVYWFLQKYYMAPGAGMVLKSINIKPQELKYIKENILNINIFDNESRVRAGITRFKNIYHLSPSPLWKKLTIIFNLQIIYSVFWVGLTKLHRRIIFLARSSFSRSK